MEAHKADFIVEWTSLMRRVKEILLQETIQEEFIVRELNMGKAIGYEKLIKTKETDTIVYAKRLNRELYTRFVKYKTAALTHTMVVILNQDRYNPHKYDLVTAYPGRIAYKEPEDLNILTKQELMGSLEFWQQHALIFDEANIDVTTIRASCPYRHLYTCLE
ncbi:MAG: hypothetical protein K0S30_1932 [Clostridia bacterium]|nr:hypothetical protein [Clostridia bacterium]